ncbi:hypothetical protein L0663_07950 [Dyadobacter sp. CY107]|uniref:hypothetical protein n=1 Tax=Dyadobacter fanqingshengii TaxID=2906443 RepID=UPI001F430D28|nr:hypothetical protein [Dyadobacter fanqingshengii]MCF2503304.1 hypothetical protein [Dyadobacter fanqingshengii]
MREKPEFKNGNSMWRWLILALLLTSIVSENFAEPRSIYRIEEVISNVKETLPAAAPFSHFSENLNKAAAPSNKYQLQRKRLRILSEMLHLHTELAISNAPALLPMVMRATGQYLKSRSISSEEPIHFHS